MNIGFKIRKLRQNEGMTQEDLAQMLNVSIQAVSRWENNQTYPDITLLPVLSNVFNITVDELLDVDVFKKQDEINKILKEDARLANIGDSDKRISYLKQALTKYPNSFQLMENLVHAMYGHYCGNPKERGALLDELIELSENILIKCFDNEIRYSVTQILCYSYNLKKQTDKAKELANKMPSFYSCKEKLLEHVLTGEEKQLQVQENTLMLTEWFYLIVVFSAIKDPLTNIKLWNKYLQLLKLVFDDEDYLFFYTRISTAHKMLARNYAKLGNIDAVIEHFKYTIEFTDKYENRPSKSNYTSIMVNKLTDEKVRSSKNTMLTLKDILEIELRNSEYEKIKELDKFKIIIDMINELE